MSIFAMLFSSSTDMCGEEPWPPVAKLSSPGRALAKAISSFTECTLSEGCTTPSNGFCIASVTVAKSFTGS